MDIITDQLLPLYFDYLTIFKFNCVTKKYNKEWLHTNIINKLKLTGNGKEHIIPDYIVCEDKKFNISDKIITNTMKYLFKNNTEIGYNDKIIFSYIPPEIEKNMGNRGNTGEPGTIPKMYYYSRFTGEQQQNSTVKEEQQNSIVKEQQQNTIFNMIYDFFKNCVYGENDQKYEDSFQKHKTKYIDNYICYNHTSNIFKKYLQFEVYHNPDLNYYYQRSLKEDY